MSRAGAAAEPMPRSALSRAVRLPLRLIPAGAVLPVLSGRLRGAKWVCGASTHGCWLGTYERRTQAVLGGLLRPGAVFFDVGANVGFFSLLASRLVGGGGRVLAFEPLPRNLGYLKEHVRLNAAANVRVVEAALGEADGAARIDGGRGPCAARVGAAGEPVAVRALDSLCADGGLPPPAVVKIDVEGHEGPVLRGAEATLRAARPSIVLSAHGWENRDRCSRLLGAWGYRVALYHAVARDGDYGLLATPSPAR